MHQAGFPLFAEPIRVALDVDRGRVVQQPVEDGARDHRVAEDLAPRARALIAAEQDRAAFIAPADELEEEIGPLPIDRDVADLVDNQELGLGHDLEPLLEAILVERLAEGRDERGGHR